MSSAPTDVIDAGAVEDLPESFSESGLRRSVALMVAVAAAVVALVVLLPGLGSLRERFAGAQPGWLALAALLQLARCASYVVVFRAVFCRLMSWRTSAQIGLSELAANSVLSVGGAGGLALGAWILRRGGLEGAYIARRTVAFFLLTSAASVGFLLLGGLGLATGLLPGGRGVLGGLVPAAAAAAAIGLALVAPRVVVAAARRIRSGRVSRAVATVAQGVPEALALLRRPSPAIPLGITGYLVFDVAVLGACFAAFGNDVPPVGVLLVAYIVGQLGGLIPLPGGIGGVDGGLIGTLALYGVDVADATVAVLAYRALLLTIPAVLGLPALAVLRRRLQAESHDIAACGPGGEVDVVGRGRVLVRQGPPRA